MGQERGERAGGEEKGGAPVGPKQKKTARVKGEKKKKKRWAGLKWVRGKKKSFPISEKVSNTFNSNSNSKI